MNSDMDSSLTKKQQQSVKIAYTSSSTCFSPIRIFHSCRPTCTKFDDVTHCIFDLDGTLLDTEFIYQTTTEAILADYGKTYTSKLRMKTLGTSSIDTCKILVAAGVKLTVERCYKVFEEKMADELLHCPFKPGAERLVRHLHANKIPLAIATMSSEEEVDYKIAHSAHFFKMFHHIVNGGNDPAVEHGKPAPDVYNVCISRFCTDVEPKNVLIFEDSPNGVTGATTAGCQVVMIPERWTPRRFCRNATLVLNTLEDFKPELFGLPRFHK